MVDILHKIGIQASPDDVYRALTTCEGLSAWWTNGTTGENKEGGIVLFRFGDRGGFDMKVLELQPGKQVLWQVIDGPQEWVGTKIHFDLRQEAGWTLVFFQHRGWREPVDFMYHCSTKWGVFLLSLKSLIETGKGAPYPDDLKIDSWE